MENRSSSRYWLKFNGNIWGYVLFFPAIFFVLAFFIAPMVIMFYTSLQKFVLGVSGTGGLTLENYIRIVTHEYYLGRLVFTTELSVLVVLFVVPLSYASAYVLARASGWKKTALLLSVTIPMWTNIIVQIFGWQLILGRMGLINNALRWLGLADKPLDLLFNLPAVVIGLVYVILPYTTLVLYATLSSIDFTLMEAALSLGAGRLRSFFEVIFPLSLPGILRTSLMAFVWSFGSYAVPSLLGSPRERTIGIEVGDQMLTVLNWPFGSAMSFVMLAVSLVAVYLMVRLERR